jgi:hypothetical protein
MLGMLSEMLGMLGEMLAISSGDQLRRIAVGFPGSEGLSEGNTLLSKWEDENSALKSQFVTGARGQERGRAEKPEAGKRSALSGGMSLPSR